MTYNSYETVWVSVAKHFNVHPTTIRKFRLHLNSEGLPFIFTRLPALGKALEHGLETGQLDILGTGFCKKKGTLYPLFLSELFMHVFDKEGYILNEPTMIRELRQLCLLFYKFEVEPSDSDITKANDAFVNRDSLVGFNNLSGHYPGDIDLVRKNFMSLLPDDPKDIRLQHSSGATADSTKLHDKIHTIHRTPAMEFFGADCVFNSLDHIKLWSESTRDMSTILPPARVVQVPKDARGPRTICCEPHTNMKYQLGLMEKIYEYIETTSPAKGYVNFSDQSINMELAQKASLDRSLTTIDLKDASDMVSWDLIQELVSAEWLEALTVTRSDVANVDGYELNFKKFAPMGSALCFPIEAILFWSIARTVTKQVWVYGDDIIVSAQDAHAVIEALESYSLIINRGKTLHYGFFRESCGGDYYRGHDISYIKCKSYDEASFIAFSNLIGGAFGRNLSDELIGDFEKRSNKIIYRRPLSEAGNPEPLVYYTAHCAASDVFFKRRWNKDHQLYEVRRPLETTHVESRDSTALASAKLLHATAPTIGSHISKARLALLDDTNRFMHWLQMSSSVSPMLSWYDEFVYESKRVRVSFMPDIRISGHAVLQPRTIWGWGVHNPVQCRKA